MEKFTIDEIRNYIKSKDSLGDVMHFLSEENIRKANLVKIEDENDEDEIFYDEDIPEYGDVYAIHEFEDMVFLGDVNSDDGTAYPAKDGKMSRDFEVHASSYGLRLIPKDATHIVWFNK